MNMNGDTEVNSPNEQPFPFLSDGLTIDELIYIRPGLQATAITFVPSTLEIFDTHFQRTPLVPGVVQVQLLVDLAAMILNKSNDEPKYWEIDTASGIKFRHGVTPGDTMTIHVSCKQKNSNGDKTFAGRILVGQLEVTRVTTMSLVQA